MKKALLVLSVFAAAIITAAAFAGCGGDKPDVWDKKEGLIAVGFSQVGAESDWRVANTKSMKDAFSEANGYDFKIKDAQQKPENQFAAVRWFIAQKADYIVIAPTVEAGWDGVLAEAKAAGIPVIIVDRMIDTKDDSLFTCWVGSDFHAEGVNAVEWMETELKADLKIVHLKGNEGASAQIGRTKALNDGKERNSGWEIVKSGYCDWTEANAQQFMQQYLASTTAFDVLYCENDNMAFGAIAAMKAKGSPTYGKNGAVTVISFDATNAGLKATLAGDINYNVECNPLHGPRVEEIIKQLREGKTPEKLQYVKEEAFDARYITKEIVDAREY